MTKEEARIEALKIIGAYRDIIVDCKVNFTHYSQEQINVIIPEIDSLRNSMVNLANKQSKK